MLAFFLFVLMATEGESATGQKCRAIASSRPDDSLAIVQLDGRDTFQFINKVNRPGDIHLNVPQHVAAATLGDVAYRVSTIARKATMQTKTSTVLQVHVPSGMTLDFIQQGARSATASFRSSVDQFQHAFNRFLQSGTGRALQTSLAIVEVAMFVMSLAQFMEEGHGVASPWNFGELIGKIMLIPEAFYALQEVRTLANVFGSLFKQQQKWSYIHAHLAVSAATSSRTALDLLPHPSIVSAHRARQISTLTPRVKNMPQLLMETLTDLKSYLRVVGAWLRESTAQNFAYALRFMKKAMLFTTSMMIRLSDALSHRVRSALEHSTLRRVVSVARSTKGLSHLAASKIPRAMKTALSRTASGVETLRTIVAHKASSFWSTLKSNAPLNNAVRAAKDLALEANKLYAKIIVGPSEMSRLRPLNDFKQLKNKLSEVKSAFSKGLTRSLSTIEQVSLSRGQKLPVSINRVAQHTAPQKSVRIARQLSVLSVLELPMSALDIGLNVYNTIQSVQFWQEFKHDAFLRPVAMQQVVVNIVSLKLAVAGGALSLAQVGAALSKGPRAAALRAVLGPIGLAIAVVQAIFCVVSFFALRNKYKTARMEKHLYEQAQIADQHRAAAPIVLSWALTLARQLDAFTKRVAPPHPQMFSTSDHVNGEVQFSLFMVNRVDVLPSKYSAYFDPAWLAELNESTSSVLRTPVTHDADIEHVELPLNLYTHPAKFVGHGCRDSSPPSCRRPHEGWTHVSHGTYTIVQNVFVGHIPARDGTCAMYNVYTYRQTSAFSDLFPFLEQQFPPVIIPHGATEDHIVQWIRDGHRYIFLCDQFNLLNTAGRYHPATIASGDRVVDVYVKTPSVAFTVPRLPPMKKNTLLQTVDGKPINFIFQLHLEDPLDAESDVQMAQYDIYIPDFHDADPSHVALEQPSFTFRVVKNSTCGTLIRLHVPFGGAFDELSWDSDVKGSTHSIKSDIRQFLNVAPNVIWTEHGATARRFEYHGELSHLLLIVNRRPYSFAINYEREQYELKELVLSLDDNEHDDFSEIWRHDALRRALALVKRYRDDANTHMSGFTKRDVPISVYWEGTEDPWLFVNPVADASASDWDYICPHWPAANTTFPDKKSPLSGGKHHFFALRCSNAGILPFHTTHSMVATTTGIRAVYHLPELAHNTNLTVFFPLTGRPVIIDVRCTMLADCTRENLVRAFRQLELEGRLGAPLQFFREVRFFGQKKATTRETRENDMRVYYNIEQSEQYVALDSVMHESLTYDKKNELFFYRTKSNENVRVISSPGQSQSDMDAEEEEITLPLIQEGDADDSHGTIVDATVINGEVRLVDASDHIWRVIGRTPFLVYGRNVCPFHEIITQHVNPELLTTFSLPDRDGASTFVTLFNGKQFIQPADSAYSFLAWWTDFDCALYVETTPDGIPINSNNQHAWKCVYPIANPTSNCVSMSPMSPSLDGVITRNDDVDNVFQLWMVNSDAVKYLSILDLETRTVKTKYVIDMASGSESTEARTPSKTNLVELFPLRQKARYRSCEFDTSHLQGNSSIEILSRDPVVGSELQNIVGTLVSDNALFRLRVQRVNEDNASRTCTKQELHNVRLTPSVSNPTGAFGAPTISLTLRVVNMNTSIVVPHIAGYNVQKFVLDTDTGRELGHDATMQETVQLALDWHEWVDETYGCAGHQNSNSNYYVTVFHSENVKIAHNHPVPHHVDASFVALQVHDTSRAEEIVDDSSSHPHDDVRCYPPCTSGHICYYGNMCVDVTELHDKYFPSNHVDDPRTIPGDSHRFCVHTRRGGRSCHDAHFLYTHLSGLAALTQNNFTTRSRQTEFTTCSEYVILPDIFQLNITVCAVLSDECETSIMEGILRGVHVCHFVARPLRSTSAERWRVWPNFDPLAPLGRLRAAHVVFSENTPSNESNQKHYMLHQIAFQDDSLALNWWPPTIQRIAFRDHTMTITSPVLPTAQEIPFGDEQHTQHKPPFLSTILESFDAFDGDANSDRDLLRLDIRRKDVYFLVLQLASLAQRTEALETRFGRFEVRPQDIYASVHRDPYGTLYFDPNGHITLNLESLIFLSTSQHDGGEDRPHGGRDIHAMMRTLLRALTPPATTWASEDFHTFSSTSIRELHNALLTDEDVTQTLDILSETFPRMANCTTPVYPLWSAQRFLQTSLQYTIPDTVQLMDERRRWRYDKFLPRPMIYDSDDDNMTHIDDICPIARSEWVVCQCSSDVCTPTRIAVIYDGLKDDPEVVVVDEDVVNESCSHYDSQTHADSPYVPRTSVSIKNNTRDWEPESSCCGVVRLNASRTSCFFSNSGFSNMFQLYTLTEGNAYRSNDGKYTLRKHVIDSQSRWVVTLETEDENEDETLSSHREDMMLVIAAPDTEGHCVENAVPLHAVTIDCPRRSLKPGNAAMVKFPVEKLRRNTSPVVGLHRDDNDTVFVITQTQISQLNDATQRKTLNGATASFRDSASYKSTHFVLDDTTGAIYKCDFQDESSPISIWHRPQDSSQTALALSVASDGMVFVARKNDSASSLFAMSQSNVSSSFILELSTMGMDMSEVRGIAAHRDEANDCYHVYATVGHCIYKVTFFHSAQHWEKKIFAGHINEPGVEDGPALSQARFFAPTGITASEERREVYTVDYYGKRVCVIWPVKRVGHEARGNVVYGIFLTEPSAPTLAPSHAVARIAVSKDTNNIYVTTSSKSIHHLQHNSSCSFLIHNFTMMTTASVVTSSPSRPPTTTSTTTTVPPTTGVQSIFECPKNAPREKSVFLGKSWYNVDKKEVTPDPCTAALYMQRRYTENTTTECKPPAKTCATLKSEDDSLCPIDVRSEEERCISNAWVQKVNTVEVADKCILEVFAERNFNGAKVVLSGGSYIMNSTLTSYKCSCPATCREWSNRGNECKYGDAYKDATWSTHCRGAKCEYKDCCDRTCAYWWHAGNRCPHDSDARRNLGNILCPDGDCTPKLCCVPTCYEWLQDSTSCNAGYMARKNLGGITCPANGCTNNICCVQTCQDWLRKHDCRSGFITNFAPGTIECRGGNCNHDLCCTRTCYNWLTEHDCSHGFLPKKGPGDIECPGNDCNHNLCCIRTCHEWLDERNCNHGFLPRKGPGDIECPSDDCNHNLCCIRTCTEWLTKQSCNSGFSPKKGPGNIKCHSNDCNNDLCCTRTCYNWLTEHDCNRGFLPKEGPGDIECLGGDCKHDLCCIRTCAEWLEEQRSCNYGFLPRKGPGNIECPSGDCNHNLCCVRTCTEWLTKQSCNSGFSPKKGPGDIECHGDDCNHDLCCTQTCYEWLVKHDCNLGFSWPRSPGVIKCHGENCNHDTCCERYCYDWFRTPIEGEPSGCSVRYRRFYSYPIKCAPQGCTNDQCCEPEIGRL